MEEADGPGTSLFATLNTESFAGYRGCCAVALRNHADAIAVLEAGCAAAAAYPWRSCTARIDLAAAYAGHSDTDHACALLTEALHLASRSRMRQIVRRVRKVYQNEFAACRHLPGVRRLDEELRSIELHG
jgi:hypothetical protein